MKILKTAIYAFIIFFILGIVGNAIGEIAQSKASPSSLQDCNVQTNNRPDGATIRYTRPTMVGSNNLLEYGLSIQTNGEEYYLVALIRFYGVGQRAVGRLNIQYTSPESSSLELYQSELTHLNGSEVCLSVYRLDEADIRRFQLGSLKSLNFKTDDGRIQIVAAKQNRNVLEMHYKCLNQ